VGEVHPHGYRVTAVDTLEDETGFIHRVTMDMPGTDVTPWTTDYMVPWDGGQILAVSVTDAATSTVEIPS
jgi:hypothetical protein